MQGANGFPTLGCVLADSSPYFRHGLGAALATQTGIEVLGCASNPEIVPEVVRELAADVVIASFEPPATAAALARSVPGVPVVVMASSLRRQDVADAVRGGVCGLVPRDIPPAELARVVREARIGQISLPCEWLVPCLNDIPSGRFPQDTRAHDENIQLTPRERQVVALVADGLSNKALARELGIAPETAKNHVHNAMAKAGVKSRLQLSAWVTQQVRA